MRRIDAGNKIILNISDRDRSDMILYPLMIAVVLFTYIVVLLYYVLSVFSEYRSDVPYEQMFGILALLLIGISLILAIFYLLMVRNTNHSKRESRLRKAMIEYVDANGSFHPEDVSQYVRQMRILDERFDSQEDMGNPKKNIVWVALPALAGFVLMWIPSLREYTIYVLLICMFLSIVVALVVAPHVTTFAAEHDKRTKEFTESFANACRRMDMKFVPTSKTVGYRSFPVFAVLTIATVGFFAIFWVYLIFNDMNKHFMEQWRYEDRLLRSVRSSGMEYVKTNKIASEYSLEDHWL